MQRTLTFRESLGQLRDRRYLSILLFGFSSGFPWVLHGTILTLWLQESGFSRSTIGFIGAITVVYAFNWTWAPFVDRLRLPYLFDRLGQRRSWILTCQLVIATLAAGLSFTHPTENLLLVGSLALGVAISSATLDISIDAYRITLFRKEEIDTKMPFAAATNTVGYFAGWNFVGGAIAIALAGETIGLDWSMVYRIIAGFYLVLIALISLTPIPEEDHERAQQEGQRTERITFGIWIMRYVVEPFREFFTRCGFKLAVSVLLLLMLFRLGEAMLGRMALVFYVEVGFTRDQISFYQAFFGGVLIAIYSMMGAVINTKFGVIRGLFFAGVAMASANLLFALLAVVGPSTNLLMLTLVIDNFFQAFATVAFVSFISYFTSRTYTGTQYALMSSISNFGRTTLAAGSGVLVDFLGGDWALFFILTTLMVIPGLALLVWVGKLMDRYTGTGSSYA